MTRAYVTDPGEAKSRPTRTASGWGQPLEVTLGDGDGDGLGEGLAEGVAAVSCGARACALRIAASSFFCASPYAAKSPALRAA